MDIPARLDPNEDIVMTVRELYARLIKNTLGELQELKTDNPGVQEDIDKRIAQLEQALKEIKK